MEDGAGGMAGRVHGDPARVLGAEPGEPGADVGGAPVGPDAVGGALA